MAKEKAQDLHRQDSLHIIIIERLDSSSTTNILSPIFSHISHSDATIPEFQKDD